MALNEAQETILEDNKADESLTWVLVGSAKTEHRSAGVSPEDGSDYLTLCGKVVADLSEGEGKNKCQNCAKVEASIVADHDAFWSPINGDEIEIPSADNNNDTKGDDVATEGKTEKTNDEIAAEVKEYIDGLVETEFPKLNKGDKDKIDALAEQAERELLRVSANKRAMWRTLVKEAKAAAMERSGTAEVAIRQEVTSVEQIKDYAEVVEHSAGVVADSIKSEVDAQEAAKKVASAILDGRLRVTDKQGRPDLKGTRQASRDLATAIYDKAAEKLIAEEYGSDVADVDELLKGLKFKVGYQMSAVLPQFVYALDNSPEEFADMFPGLKVDEDKKPSDAVFETYGIPRESKAEIAKRKRREAKELATKVEKGELTQAEADAAAEESESEGEGSTRAEKSQFEKDMAKLDKMPKDLSDILGRKDERSEEESQKMREKMTATITALTEALTKA